MKKKKQKHLSPGHVIKIWHEKLWKHESITRKKTLQLASAHKDTNAHVNLNMLVFIIIIIIYIFFYKTLDALRLTARWYTGK